MKAREFSISLEKWADKIPQDAVVPFVKKVTFELLRKVTMKSPVDTGRFRANWMVGIGQADPSTVEETENVAIPRGMAVLGGYREPVAVHVSNNLPYASALEDGHSKQAPAGVVGISVAEINAHLDGGK